MAKPHRTDPPHLFPMPTIGCLSCPRTDYGYQSHRDFARTGWTGIRETQAGEVGRWQTYQGTCPVCSTKDSNHESAPGHYPCPV